MRTRLVGFLILAAIGITISECSSADRNDSGDIVSSGDVQASDVRLGDCFNNLPAERESFSSVKAVPCSESHQWQLFYRGTLSLSSYSEVEVRKAASDMCNDAANSLFNQMSAIKFDAFKNAELGFFSPSKNSWSARNDRSLECLVGSDIETYFTSVFD